MAIASSARTIAPPMAPRGWRRANRSTRLTSEGSRHVRGSVSGTESVWTEFVNRRLVTDSRIQYGVHEIDRQIRQDDDDNDDQVDPLDHRIVALHDRVDEELSHARDAEDPLDDHRAAGDARHLEADHRHPGDHRG